MKEKDAPRRFLGIDVETTGLDPVQDRIVEFALVECDPKLRVIGTWSQRVNPEVRIPAAVSRIHGIHDEDVHEAPSFAHYARRVTDLASEAVLIGHNLVFDLQFLNAELDRAGIPSLPPSQESLDTLLLEKGSRSHTLSSLYRKYTGRDLTGAHSAGDDALAAIEVLKGQVRERGGPWEVALGEIIRASSVEWLDRGRMLYKDSEGVVRFAFGKNRGLAASDHRDYLSWMLGGGFPEDTRAVIRTVLRAGERRTRGQNGRDTSARDSSS